MQGKAKSSTKCYGCIVADPEALSAMLESPAGYVLAGVFGAIWGSFFNVCIARIPRGQSVIRPPSHCFSCGKQVRAIDNIPLLSYLLLRGRCRFCQAQFSPRYFLVELLTAALSVLVWWRFVAGAEAALLPLGVRAARYALYFTFTGVLVVLSFIDLDTKRLPDVITLPAIPILFLAAFAAHHVPWKERAIGAVAGYLVVRIIADGYYYLRGREGLGLGDGKLLSVVGAVVGWKAIPVVIFMGSFLGLFVSVPVLLARQRRERAAAPSGAVAAPPPPEPTAGPPPDMPPQEADTVTSVRHTEVPFGPFLALSAMVYLLFGDELWMWLTARLEG
jgi:leader peptidase (prepilin peptidase) / N-methyltransferase